MNKDAVIRIIRRLLLLYVAVTVVFIMKQWINVEPAATPLWQPDDRFVVTYFHSNKRCMTCNNMEKFTTEAVKAVNKKLSGKNPVRMRVLNWQDDENKVYTKRYKLAGNSVILSYVKDGHEATFKELPEIWPLSSDEGRFVSYVEDELMKFISVSDSTEYSAE